MRYKNRKTISQVSDIVEEHGIGYAVESFMSYRSIEDLDLRQAWFDAEIAIDKIRAILDYHLEE